jgi:hypothetical protein
VEQTTRSGSWSTALGGIKTCHVEGRRGQEDPSSFDAENRRVSCSGSG